MTSRLKRQQVFCPNPNFLLNSVEEMPCLLVGNEIDDVESFQYRKLHSMKEGITGRCGLISTFSALPGMSQLSFTVVGVSTFLTNETIWPFKLCQMLIAGIIIRK
tara:strand:- start:140 stop:454 length:315 start_codon:yes stop_codon:yes gene_type:complete